MKKWQGSLLVVVLFAVVFVGIPLALFSTLSGTFAPPVPGSLEARVPSLPYPIDDAVLALPQASKPETPLEVEGQAPEDPPDVPVGAASGIIEDASVAELIAAFQERHPDGPRKPDWHYHRAHVPEEITDMALAVLQGMEPDDSLLGLMRHPELSVRTAAIGGMLAAQNAQMSAGASGMVAFLARTGKDDLNRLVRCAAETLIADTQAGRSSNAQVLLLFLGDYAQPALPHLVWASWNHPNADMRAYTMNIAFMLNPQSGLTRDVIYRGLNDPSGSVRMQALGDLLFRPLEIARRHRGDVPPAYLQRRPSDGFGGSVTADVPQVPAQKSALKRL